MQRPVVAADLCGLGVSGESRDEGVVFDLGPEVGGMRLDSIVTVVFTRHDHREHLALRAAQLRRAMHRAEIQADMVAENGAAGVQPANSSGKMNWGCVGVALGVLSPDRKDFRR